MKNNFYPINFEMLNKNVLTDVLKHETKRVNRDYMVAENDDYIYISIQGHNVYKIYKSLYFLNNESIDNYKFSDIFETEAKKETFPAFDTMQTFFIPATKTTVKKFVFGENKEHSIYVNVDYFKPLNNDITLEYKATNPKAPLQVYYSGELYALLLPVNYTENNN